MATFGIVEGAAIASAVIGAAGTGLSVYGQQQAASQQSALANYNYEIEKQNAKIKSDAAKIQAGWYAQQAANQQQTQLNNAASLEAQARAVESQGREAGRRLQQENEARLAIMRTRYAKAGVTTEGSPLATMARSAGLLELALQDKAFATEMEARAYDRQAEGERYQAGYSFFDKQVAEYQQAAASAGMALDMNVAKANRMAAQSAAQSANLSSYGTILTGFNNVLQTGMSAYDRRMSYQPMQPKKARPDG